MSAKILTFEHEYRPLGGGVWAVLSGNTGNAYRLVVKDGQYMCSCKGYQFRSHCSHGTDFLRKHPTEAKPPLRVVPKVVVLGDRRAK